MKLRPGLNFYFDSIEIQLTIKFYEEEKIVFILNNSLVFSWYNGFGKKLQHNISYSVAFLFFP